MENIVSVLHSNTTVEQSLVQTNITENGLIIEYTRISPIAQNFEGLSVI